MSNERGGAKRKPNRLINEQSPYLRQHAYNPVDWYPWGDEALDKSRAEDKPILLSIGYSACHWCHVMERESFENDQIAALMNSHFVPIKVDREERPDLDQIYMDAVQLLTGRGGWPLTVFLTPDCKPFYGGTYFPPNDRQGMPGFRRVLVSIAQAYREKPLDIATNVGKLTAAIGALGAYEGAKAEIRADLPALAARALSKSYDNQHGGLGQAPKFPNTFVFALFLRVLKSGGGAVYDEMVRHTLTMMAKGGIYDQIGGGFHRYSVDDRWLVPHFEKMLYDNALLARLYIDAARSLDEPEFLETAREIFDYVLREMTSPEGGFFSTQDADSEGEEGKFFVWTPAQAQRVLGDRLFEVASRWFDIDEFGNFEGHSILHRTIDASEAARLLGISEDEVVSAVHDASRKLFAAREHRVKPGRDEKVLAAWNGMMISALAEGFRALSEPRYLDAAKRGFDFIMTRLWDGRALKRSFKDGAARFNAYLEDYGLLANAAIDLYEASLDQNYLVFARTLAEIVLERFLDREKGGFFFTSIDHEQLITRSKAAFDGSTPSGNSAAVMALLRLHGYTGEPRYLTEAERALKLFAPFMEQQPFAFSHMLEAVDLYTRGATEVVLVGDRKSPEFDFWLERLGLMYLPNRAIFAVDPNAPPQAFLPEAVRGKSQIDRRLTAYVCRDRSCTAPLTSIEGLEAELRL
ncbi:MAG TPA: thioredoxin domain-containing protein [Candidatus Binataceae bacterium]|jgi:hypothetical protein